MYYTEIEKVKDNWRLVQKAEQEAADKNSLKPKYGEVGYRCEPSRRNGLRPECKEKLCCGSAKSADTTLVVEFCQSKIIKRVKYLIPGDTEQT